MKNGKIALEYFLKNIFEISNIFEYLSNIYIYIFYLFLIILDKSIKDYIYYVQKQKKYLE